MTRLEAQGPPLPTRQVMHQWWRDITFLHWPVDPARLTPLMPAGVRPDVFDGAGWVGLIPFRMVDAGLGDRRRVPWFGTFLETNVRLYSVDARGRHGVVFLTLDAERLAVVLGAVLTVGVPYRWARMGYAADGTTRSYRSRRRAPGRTATRISVDVGAPVEPSDLDLFLTARFGLHTRVAGRTLWVPNTHGPWPLHRARLLDLDDEAVAAAGLPGVVDDEPASVLHSPGVRTTFGLPQAL